MDINLKPKYGIGQKIDGIIFIGKEKIKTDHLIVGNIFATYNFKTKEIVYDYELRYADEDYDYVYQIVRL